MPTKGVVKIHEILSDETMDAFAEIGHYVLSKKADDDKPEENIGLPKGKKVEIKILGNVINLNDKK